MFLFFCACAIFYFYKKKKMENLVSEQKNDENIFIYSYYLFIFLFSRTFEAKIYLLTIIYFLYIFFELISLYLSAFIYLWTSWRLARTTFYGDKWFHNTRPLNSYGHVTVIKARTKKKNIFLCDLKGSVIQSCAIMNTFVL